MRFRRPPVLIGAALAVTLLLAVGAAATPARAEVLVNGDFESTPFDDGWTNTTSASSVAGIAPGSATAAKLGWNTSGNLYQHFAGDALTDWELDLYLNLAGTSTNRSLNMVLHAGDFMEAGAGTAVNVRLAGGSETPGAGATLQAYNGSAWQDLSTDDFFAANQTYRLNLAGTGFGSGAAGYDVRWSGAGSTNLDYEVAGASVFQDAGAAAGNALEAVRFARMSNDYNSYTIDDVSLTDTSTPPPPPEEHIQVSGIYPHLAAFNNSSECGIGGVAAWAGSLWYMSYSPHAPSGSGDKLYQVDADLNRTTRPESVGGTDASRFIHTDSDQLILGPYFIDAAGDVRAVSHTTMPGRLTGVGPSLADPTGSVYFFTMEEGLYEVDVDSLAVTTLHTDGNVGGSSILPGDHGKGGYTAQGRFIVSNNGNGGCLAEWDGTGDPANAASWTVVDTNNYTEVTGPGGLTGPTDPDDPVWALGWDARSVLLNVRTPDAGGTWTRYRLPKASYTHDAEHGWYTEWPRIRDVGADDLLMDMHGMFYAFPEGFEPGATAGITPISTHLKMVVDFADWDGTLVMACNDTSKFNNPSVGQAQSNLWFGSVDDLAGFGAAAGWGGPLVGDAVQAGTPSEPFLFSGFEDRVVHLAHTAAEGVTFTLEVDDGTGAWTPQTTVTVPADEGYAYHVFDAADPGTWIRATADADAPSATAYFHYANPPQTPAPAMFQSLPAPDQAQARRSEGIIRPLAGGRLGYLANVVENGAVVDTRYYEVDEGLGFTRIDDAGKVADMQAHAVTDTGFTIDDASVIVADGGTQYRLPKGASVYDAAWATGWPRGMREVVTERSLLNACGTFYEVPRDASGGIAKIRPVTTHNRMIYDFCSWRGMLVLTGNLSDASEDGHYFAASTPGEVLFSDPFETDPGAAGWTEILGDANSRIELAPSGSQAVIYQASGSSDVASSIERTFDTTGYEHVLVDLTAFQHGGSYEGSELLDIAYNTGGGWTALLTDMEVWHGENDLTGEGSDGNDGNTAPTATGALLLPPAAAGNQNLAVRITAKTGWFGGFDNGSSEAFYLDLFQLFGVPEGGWDGTEDAGLWFGNVDDLWKLGAPRGYGGPWLDTPVAAGQASDPYLMAGYDEKKVDLSHDADEVVAFLIEVDVRGEGVWHPLTTVDVPAGETVTYTFPDGYSAHWVRVTSDQATSATAMFTYVPEPATLLLMGLGLGGLVLRRR